MAASFAEPVADARADRAARAKSRVDAIRSAIRSHAALTLVGQTLESMDPFLIDQIESGTGTATTIRPLLQECIDSLTVLDERRNSAAAVAELEMAAPRLVYTLLLQLIEVDVGTLRGLRLTTVISIERAARALLEPLIPWVRLASRLHAIYATGLHN